MIPETSIHSRLMAVTVIAVLAVALTASLGLLGMRRSNVGLDEAITATTAVLHQKHADMMHDALRGDVLSALLTGPDGSPAEREAVLADLADHAASFNDSVASLQALPLPDQIRTQVDQLIPLLNAYVASAQDISTSALSAEGAGDARLDAFKTAFTDLEGSMETLGELIESRGSAAASQAQRRNETLILALLIGSALAALVLAAITRSIGKGILGPLNQVKLGLTELAQGNLGVTIAGTARRDEIGQIAKSLEVLRATLLEAREKQTHLQQGAQQRVVGALSVGLRNLSQGNLTHRIEDAFADDYEMLRDDYNQTLERLNQTISQVVAVSDSIRARSDEIRQSSEELSIRTETQAATLEETAAALDQLTASVKSAADGAKEVESVVTTARTEAMESGTVVQGAVAAMNEIERSSAQISQIIGVIDDIAFQTNLLALNAGVEAARAGEAGRGFAVVASEVRALAQRSSSAAKEIKVLISASTQHVDRGVDQVGRAGTALSTIVDRVSQISALVSSIASGAREQSLGLAEVNIGVSQLDQVTQQNASMVQDSTQASQSLNEEAIGMAELVAQFTTRATRSDAPRRSEPRRAVAGAGMRGMVQSF